MKKLFTPALLKALLIVLFIPFNLFAQLLPPPNIDWKRTDWWPSFTQAGSGDDWWYDHANSVDATGAIDGYICAGYYTKINKYINENEYSDPGCLFAKTPEKPSCIDFETENRFRGSLISDMALINPDGKSYKWYKRYLPGTFYRVIQTKDGGYAAVGVTGATRDLSGNPLYYNPNQTPGAVTDKFDFPQDCSSRQDKIQMVKVDKNGNVQWKYIYGVLPYQYSGTDGTNALSYSTEAQDLIETENGDFIIAGTGVNPATTLFFQFATGKLKAASSLMIRVASNGHYISGNFIGPLDQESRCNAVAQFKDTDGNNKYLASGIQTYDYTNSQNIQEHKRYVYLRRYNENLDLEWEKTFSHINGLDANNYDIEVQKNNQNRILLPVIEACNVCGSAGDNAGNAVVYMLDPTTGDLLGKTDSYPVHGYDLKHRAITTKDGGFATVSTTVEYSSYLSDPCTTATVPAPGFWNSNAIVKKYDIDGLLEWEKTWDVDNKAPVFYPGDYKKQECLYTITQGPGGGLVVSGNNSFNFDDNYLVKLLDDCPSRIDYDATSYVASAAVGGGISWAYSTNTWEPGNNPFGGGSTVSILKSLTIKQGKTIIIKNMTFKFGHNAIVTVERDAKLILDNTIFTAVDCPETKWFGVEVHGTPDLPHPTNPVLTDDAKITGFGYLKLRNNSVITYASIGVKLIKVVGDNFGSPSESDHYNDVDVSLAGGIVQAENSSFINNGKDIEFLLGPTNSNISYFTGCKFKTINATARPRTTPSDHVSMYAVKGVKFTNCKFINEIPEKYGFNHKGNGIFSIDADYQVSTNTIFENLTFGIRAKGAAGLSTLNITGNTFKNNNTGFMLEGTSYATIKGNTFVIPGITKSTPVNTEGPVIRGAELRSSGGFVMQKNTMSNTKPDQGIYGLIVDNSGSGGGQVYGNDFKGTHVKNQMQKNNSKLGIDCNTYGVKANAGSFYDWAITSGTLVDQGKCFTSPPTDPQANLFLGTNSGGKKQIFAFSQNNGFKYSAYSNQTTLPTAVSNMVEVENCLKTFNNINDACPGLEAVGGGGPDENKIKNEIMSFTNFIQKLKAKIDGGNTEGMLAIIGTAAADEIHQILLNASPFLSDRVIFAFLNRQDPGPPEKIREILVANSKLSGRVKEKVENMVLPANIREQVEAAQTNPSARLQLENEIRQLERDKKLLINQLNRKYLEESSPEKVIELLEAQEEIENSIEIIPVALDKRDFIKAETHVQKLRSAISGIPQEELNEERNIELKESEIFYSKMNETAQRPGGIHSLNEIELGTIKEIASRNTEVSVKAQNILEYLGIDAFDRTPEPIIDGVDRNSEVIESESISPFGELNSSNDHYKILPNPSNGDVKFYYSLIDNSNIKTLLITDIMGKLINEGLLTEKTGEKTFTGLKNGVYFFTVLSKTGPPNIHKVIVIEK